MSKKHQNPKKSSYTEERRQVLSAASPPEESKDCVEKVAQSKVAPTYNLQSFEYIGFRS